ncbi:hypothetical protein BCON_0253g00140 [Botryotinia convoluta]|uniref:Uncharacterized protein n=1 Tax=Botryotinia convoluta TaxID=54673 RepID=A0A4Z1HGY2_9HELO|nr:hypothetical protein BCON_0253g00140 [Botryotinia convoluta]
MCILSDGFGVDFAGVGDWDGEKRRGGGGGYGWEDAGADCGEAVEGEKRACCWYVLFLRRRYMRFFRFIKNFSKAWDSLLNEDGMRMLINVGKSGFMGAYLGLESLTILDIMGVCNTPWSSTCALEGNKFWFYSLSISIFGGLWDLYHLLANNDTTPKPNSQENTHDPDLAAKPVENTQVVVEQPGKNKKKGKSKTQIFLKISENTADLFLPGAGTGWIYLEPPFNPSNNQPQPQPPPPPSFEMEDSIDTALLFKQIKEKVKRDGDDQGEVTEELFESELKVLRKRLRLKKPEDTPLEHEIRTANSICAYFWNKNGIRKAYQLFPDAFEPRSTQKPPEVKNEKVEKKPAVASASSSPSTTMIADIPLHDWLILKQGDPDTAKELMDDWKAEQAAFKAAASAEKNSEEAKVNSKSAAKKELKE